jgi:hypothetical protein
MIANDEKQAQVRTASCSNKQLIARYRQSDEFDSSHFIHKYYISPEDKSRLFPVDIFAFEEMICRDEVQLQKGFHECTILYSDLCLEKHLDSGLVQRTLQAMARYKNDLSAKLTAEEVRAALNLNEWLRCYEKTLCTKRQRIEQELNKGLMGSDPFLVDYEIELKMDFYVREDDLFYENDEANENDWDKDASQMCCLNYRGSFTPEDELSKPGNWGVRDDQGHNNTPESTQDRSVNQVRHCTLFHELTEHCGVPLKHLIRIGTIWANIEVIHQNAVDIDLSGEPIVANQKEVNLGKLQAIKNNLSPSFQGEMGSEKIR